MHAQSWLRSSSNITCTCETSFQGFLTPSRARLRCIEADPWFQPLSKSLLQSDNCCLSQEVQQQVADSQADAQPETYQAADEAQPDEVQHMQLGSQDKFVADMQTNMQDGHRSHKAGRPCKRRLTSTERRLAKVGSCDLGRGMLAALRTRLCTAGYPSLRLSSDCDCAESLCQPLLAAYRSFSACSMAQLSHISACSLQLLGDADALFWCLNEDVMRQYRPQRLLLLFGSSVQRPLEAYEFQLPAPAG